MNDPRGTVRPDPSREFNPLEAAIGVITRPAEAMRQIAAARPWSIALPLTVGIALLTGAASLTAPPQDLRDQPGAESLPEAFLDTLDFIQSPGGVIVNAFVFSLLSLVIASGIYYLVGRLLGGRGAFSGLLSTQAFAAIPGVLLAPITALLNLAGVAALGGLFSIGFSIWSLVLTVLGIRESLSLSTGRAVATLLIPLVVLVLLVLVVTFILVFVVLAASGS